MSQSGSPVFEPRILAFLCNWCSYAGADKAGAMQQEWPANLQILRVMCSGRVNPELVMEALAKGADGVLILACHPGDCHYKEGNYRAAVRSELLATLLRQLDIDERRLRLDYVSAGEAERFTLIVNEMAAQLCKIGPLRSV
jgi:F420-non-reducing hydrogenase iron-sulfur subunit